jgi:hypothetical protein
MAGLPLDRPIPGSPLLDPLGQEAPILPEGPLVGGWPPPFSEQVAGPPSPAPALSPPVPFPPPDWFGTPEGLPTEQVGQDVPVVENQPPPQEPPVTPQVGEQGLAALDQARKDGQLLQPYPEERKPAKPAPPVDPYIQAAEQSAQDHKAAVEAKAQALREKNDYLAAQGLQAASDYSTRQAEADRMYMDAYKEAKGKRAQLDKEALDIANTKIDPRRAWHDASFGAKVFVAVTAALTGATTRAVQTGQNPVLDSVNGILDRDMKAQQMELENRTNMLGVRRGLLADDLAAGRDLLDYQYKSAMAAYDMAKNAMTSYALKYDNAALTADVMEQNAKIDDAKREWQMNYEAAKRKEALEREKWKQENARGWKGLSLHQQQLDEQKRHNQAEENAAKTVGPNAAMINATREGEKDRRERLILRGKTKDGRQLYAKDKEAATKVNEEADATTKSVAILDELTDIYSKHGYELLGTWSGGDAGKDEQRANFLIKKLWSTFSKKEGQGTIRDSEYEMYREMFGDPSGLRDPRALFGQVRQTFIDDVNDDMAGQALDEQGNVVDHTYWLPEEHLKKPEDKTEAKGNVQGQAFEPAPTVDEKKGYNTEGYGRNATPEEVAAHEKATPKQTGAEWEREQRNRFEVRRQANIAALRRNPRIELKDLPYPSIGLSGNWDPRQGEVK